MTATIERVAATAEAWRAAATAGYRAGEALIQDGKRVRMKVEEDDDPLTLRQLRFIHGPVLQQISEQVRVNGIQYTKEVWKAHLKDLFIPDRWEMRRLPYVRDRKTGLLKPSTRAVPVKVEKSLKNLGVKKCSLFIDQVLAHAATEWAVQFRFLADEREAVRYQPARRRVAESETV